MVTIDFSQKLVRRLEIHLLSLADYQLPIKGYDLILLLPIAPDSWSEKRTLLLSAASLLAAPRWDATYGVLSALRAGLDDEEYLSIYNVDLIEPSAFAVQRVKHYLADREDGESEAPIALIGGVTNQTVTAVKSTVLEKLVFQQNYEVTLGDARVFRGKFLKFLPTDQDVSLVFDADGDQRECFYSEISRLSLVPA